MVGVENKLTRRMFGNLFSQNQVTVECAIQLYPQPISYLYLGEY